MNKYDFSSLNDKEFEVLCADLISKQENVRIERFKPGKDLGVDGRWFASPNKECVLQCKHWLKSGYDMLVKHLKKSEKSKIDKLSPAKYVLCTSIELSRTQKQYIKQLLAPHIKSDSDILGTEDITDLLAKYAEIEKKHYKLWMTSTNILEYIFKNGTLGRSEFVANSIKENLRYHVYTTDFSKALQALVVFQV